MAVSQYRQVIVLFFSNFVLFRTADVVADLQSSVENFQNLTDPYGMPYYVLSVTMLTQTVYVLIDICVYIHPLINVCVLLRSQPWLAHPQSLSQRGEE